MAEYKTGISMEKKKIVLVDDHLTNLTACKKALRDLYEVYPVPSADKMFEVLEHTVPDLIMLDVEMPGTNGFEAIKILKSNDKYKEIPVIFLSAMDDAQSEMEGLNLGAVDYIHKPFVSELLIKRIVTHISVIDGKKQLKELNKSIEELLNQTTQALIPQAEAEKNAIRQLIKRNEVFSKIGHEIRAPLNNIIEMIETAIKSDDMATIKFCLGQADIETRLILEIVDDVIDVTDV